MKHLFIIDPITKLNKEMDTTLKFAFKLQANNHQVFFTERQNFSLTFPNSLMANVSPVNFGDSPQHINIAPPSFLPSSAFSAIHVRIDPPFDLNYIGLTWLLNHSRTLTLNDPEALRTYNEKLALFFFPEASAPSYVSCNPDQILSYIKTLPGQDAVLKPLNLYGGRGVMRLQVGSKSGEEDARKAIGEACENGSKYVLIQPFMPEIFEGEVRVFTAFGQPVSWCLKKPEPGNFLANTGQGATLLPYQPKAEEHILVSKVAKELAKNGVMFCGMDMINGLITEINITSPRLLTPDKEQENKAFAELTDLYLKFLESYVH